MTYCGIRLKYLLQYCSALLHLLRLPDFFFQFSLLFSHHALCPSPSLPCSRNLGWQSGQQDGGQSHPRCLVELLQNARGHTGLCWPPSSQALIQAGHGSLTGTAPAQPDIELISMAVCVRCYCFKILYLRVFFFFLKKPTGAAANRDSGSVKPSQSNGEAGKRRPSGGKGKKRQDQQEKNCKEEMFYAYSVNLFKSTPVSKRQEFSKKISTYSVCSITILLNWWHM